MKNKKLLLNDIILSIIVIIISLSVYLGIFLFKKNTEYGYIEIYRDGAFVAELSLSEDKIFDVPDCDFSIEIKNRTASVLHTDCNDRVCETMKADSGGGEIVCLPNRIVIRAKGADNTNSDLTAG